MQLAKNVYKHKDDGFEIQVDSCNKKVAKCTNRSTQDSVVFNRGKLEWMIKKGVFEFTGKVEGWE